MTITKKQIALLHVAKRDLGLDDDMYRALLGSVGVFSSKKLTNKQFDELLAKLKRAGFKPVHGSAKKSGMQRVAAPGKERLLSKIGALLADQELPWSYADGIAKRMYSVERVRWCKPEQLRAVVAALVYRQKRSDNHRGHRGRRDKN